MVKKIANIGVSDDLNFRERRILQIMNVCSILMASVIIIPLIYNLMIGETTNGLILIAVSGLFLLNLFWNYLGKQLISKIVIAFIVSLVPMANLMISGSIPDGQFLSLLPVTVLSVFGALLVFDRYQEPMCYYLSIIYYTLYAAFFDQICALMGQPHTIEFLEKHYFFYKIPFVLSVLLISAVFTFFKRVIYEYEESVEKAKQMLQQKNDELNVANKNLEEKINERTKELLASRGKIIDLAFITAHEIRGPLTSILAFTSYFGKHRDDETISEILPQLHEKSAEMDHVITKMVKSLEGEHLVETLNGKSTLSKTKRYRPTAGA